MSIRVGDIVLLTEVPSVNLVEGSLGVITRIHSSTVQVEWFSPQKRRDPSDSLESNDKFYPLSYFLTASHYLLDQSSFNRLYPQDIGEELIERGIINIDGTRFDPLHSSQVYPKCPVCGFDGFYGFNSFECVGIGCQNQSLKALDEIMGLS